MYHLLRASDNKYIIIDDSTGCTTSWHHLDITINSQIDSKSKWSSQWNHKTVSLHLVIPDCYKHIIEFPTLLQMKNVKITHPEYFI